ncbi:IclR family transcriptional regulator [Streptomyces sp. NBC_00344]|uniref:IclR family transcriptional regulator n=1 Tax=Streptomyces sp. NBC_00344 TaxID=2975720 RepID=UPI002E1B5750
MPQSTGVPGVKSAARTVALLELLADRGDRASRLDELAADLSVPRSSMYQLLQTLVDRGWVRSDTTGSLYGIGIRALLTGTSYLDSDRHARMVRPYLDEASDALGETIHMARRDGSDVVYLVTRESHEYPRTISRVGRRIPAHANALGKALLAEYPDAGLPLPELPLRALTENTLTDPARLIADLAAVRERGYSIEREETVAGIAGFGFALHYGSPAIDAISCSVPVHRLTRDHEARIVSVMRDVQTRIETLLPPSAGDPDWR